MEKNFLKIKQKEFYFNLDFNKDLLHCFNVEIKDGVAVRRAGYTQEKSLPSDEVKDVITYKNNLYYLVGNKICLLSSGSYQPVNDTTISGKCNCLPVLVNGEEKAFIFNSSKGVVLGLEKQPEIVLQFAPYSEVCMGRIFQADSNKIYFSGKFDYLSNTHDLKVEYFIEVKSKYGEICGMASIDDQLFVFTKNTILKVVQDEMLDLKIEKLSIPVSTVMEKSIGKAGSYILFASNGELFKFDGKKVEKMNISIGENYSFYSLPRSADGYYIGLIKRPNYLLQAIIIDSANNGFFKINEVQNIMFSNQGGYAVDNKNKKLLTFSLDGNSPFNATMSYREKKYANDVAIIGFECQMHGSCTVQFGYLSGTRNYNLSKGKNYVKCFIPTGFGSLYIKDMSNDFRMENFKIKMRKRGVKNAVY